MANRNITFSFRLSDEFTQVSKRIATNVDGLRAKFRKFNSELEQQGVSWKGVSDKLSGWASKMKWVSAGIIASGTAALVASGNYEKLGIQFEILTGSVSKGRKLLNELRSFALKAGPFESDEIMSAAKSMLNYGFAAEDVMKNLKMMATLAAGAELPLETVVRAVGMAQKSGRVDNRSLRPLKKLGLDVMLESWSGLSHKAFKKALGAGLIDSAALFTVLNDKAATFGDILGRLDNTSGEILGDTKTILKQITEEIGFVINDTTNANGVMSNFNANLENIRDSVRGWAAENPGIVKFIEYVALALIIATPLLYLLAGIAAAMAGLAVMAAIVGIGMLPLTLIFVGLIAAIIVLVKYWDQLVKLMDRTKSWFMGTGFGQALQMVGMIDTTNTNKAAVDINVKADKGATATARGKSLSPGLDLGINMWPGATLSPFVSGG